MVSAVRYRIRCNFVARRITENIQTVYSQVNYFYFFYSVFQSLFKYFFVLIILSIVSQSQIHADTFWWIGGGNDAGLGIGSPCG